MNRTARRAGILLVSLLALGTSSARARPSLAARPQVGGRPADTTPAPRSPALLVKISDDAPSEPLTITKVEVGVVITGFLAETTTTLTFQSAHPRVLEGELVFPLPEGATISGYALDVAGDMVDGVVVERHEARIAFEQERRKGIDPGLAEWVKGNNFRTRVWPIPPRGRRTVRVRYVSDLLTRPRGERFDALYALPLRYGRPVADFGLKVEVVKGAVPPEVREGGVANFRFESWEDRYVAEARLRDVAPAQDLVVALPDLPRENVAIETDEEGRRYFVIVDLPPVPAAAPAPFSARKVGLFWDASLSRDKADHRAERALVQAWARRAGDVDVDVVVFRNVPEPPRTLAVRGGDAREILELLDGLAYDGGTNLGLLRFARGHDYDLLFSDGLATLGAEAPRAAEVPVYAVGADAQANHALLDHLARTSGGAYLNLQRIGPEEAVESIGPGAFSFLSAEYDPATIADLAPAGPRRVHGRMTLAGRLLVPETTIALRYGRGGEVETRRYTLRADGARAGRLVPRFWAQQRVAEMSVLPERNHDELLRLGRRFGIVTPGTSLLVLETVEQYVEHRIEPPATRAALRAEYRRRLQQAQLAEKKGRGDKLARVLEMWNRRVQWWERTFAYRDDLRVRERDAQEAIEGGVAGGVPGGILGGVVGGRPLAPPPPAPARSAPEGFGTTAETVNVTAGLGRGDAAVMSKDEMKAAMGASAGRPDVVLKAWDPSTPYLTVLRQVRPGDAYAAFLTQRREYGSSPAFYLDCADHFLRAGQRALGLRVLTDVVELQLEEPRLLRIAAHRLQQVGEVDAAVDLFEGVLRLRPEEPQSLRDLALALEARGDARRLKAGKGSPALAADYRRAVELLGRIVLGDWDARFPEIEVIAIEEANRMIAVVERDPAFGRVMFPLDPRLRRLLDTDVRIVMTWDTDDTDMDLWVVEPSGEKCYYSHALTATGGTISSDFTGGYGPEEYLVRRALPGPYRVQTNFYGSRSQSLTGATTVQATVITDFGRPDEKRQALTLRLAEARDVVDVGTVRFGPPATAKVTR
jgi:Ca-activated chloride channel homolog